MIVKRVFLEGSALFTVLVKVPESRFLMHGESVGFEFEEADRSSEAGKKN
ncbi:hypothetical protein [Salipaludibacillus keqinensis]|nr:hypothetical protein [Salipaludibacillus keqinensis]